MVCFDNLTHAGDQQIQAGDPAAALAPYQRAAELCRGDLRIASDASTVIERERLRARYITLLAQLADHHYRAGDYSTSLEYLWRLLARDPGREDAHRLVMRCYGELSARRRSGGS